jgi:rare lipoprotein A
MKLRTSQMALFALVILGLLTIVKCSRRANSVVPAPAAVNSPELQCIQRGVASWYGASMKGRLTASGERYDPKALRAASRIFPFGTKLNIINLKNDQNVTVTVNDRGPYIGKRIMDMSIAAAHELGMEEDGLANVCVQSMEQADAQADLDKDTPK